MSITAIHVCAPNMPSRNPNRGYLILRDGTPVHFMNESYAMAIGGYDPPPWVVATINVSSSELRRLRDAHRRRVAA